MCVTVKRRTADSYVNTIHTDTHTHTQTCSHSCVPEARKFIYMKKINKEIKQKLVPNSCAMHSNELLMMIMLMTMMTIMMRLTMIMIVIYAQTLITF